jgi:sterol desaturase/sphingolipid hydroxylase (fatty acid hydroxylase superfamily)
VVIGDIRAAFHLRAIFSYLRNNQGVFFNAWFVSIGIWFVCGVIIGAVFFLVALLFSSMSIQAGGIAGVIAAVIVMGPITFTAQVILVHLFAQSYRIARPFEDDQDGVFRASMVMPPSLKQKKQE